MRLWILDLPAGVERADEKLNLDFLRFDVCQIEQRLDIEILSNLAVPIPAGVHAEDAKLPPLLVKTILQLGELDAPLQSICAKRCAALGGAEVKLLGVVADHAVGVENRRELP